MGEAVQTPYGDEGAGRRRSRQRRMLVVTGAQGDQESRRSWSSPTVRQPRHPVGGQVFAVAAQVSPVGRQAVGGEPALDGEVIEIAADGLRRRRQRRVIRIVEQGTAAAAAP